MHPRYYENIRFFYGETLSLICGPICLFMTHRIVGRVNASSNLNEAHYNFEEPKMNFKTLHLQTSLKTASEFYSKPIKCLKPINKNMERKMVQWSMFLKLRMDKIWWNKKEKKQQHCGSRQPVQWAQLHADFVSFILILFNFPSSQE
jgi:hypothetical protein